MLMNAKKSQVTPGIVAEQSEAHKIAPHKYHHIFLNQLDQSRKINEKNEGADS
jgi:hypothetical protein